MIKMSVKSKSEAKKFKVQVKVLPRRAEREALESHGQLSQLP